jgi:acyl-CoA reductase-like NAD-dependent aldehyde dehydrogenase
VRFGGERGGYEERVRYMAAIAEEALAPLTPPEKEGFRRYVKREPLGLVLAVAPWNYPYLTASNVVFPALIAGNALILKHASQTLLVGDRFQTAFDRAGAPAGVFQNVVLSHEQTERLLRSRLVDHVQFTGSVAGGKAMERAAAGTFATLGLELGGKDPAYVRPDAKLDHAVENLVDGSFFNSGQSCCGIERIYVHQDVYETFVEGFVELTRKYQVGDPLQADTTLGPMARASFADHVREQTAEALRKGAQGAISA